jgi:uncharacterized tellurite resistance protein B-like protein
MLEALRSLFASRPPESSDEAAGSSRRLQVAACALLLELAHADSEYTAEEKQRIEEIAMRHFDLDAERAREVMRVADEARREAVDLHQFTNLVVQNYDEGQRIVLAELMWRVIQADGKLAEQETQLARKLVHLLDLQPGYLAEARRRVERSRSREPRGGRRPT